MYISDSGTWGQVALTHSRSQELLSFNTLFAYKVVKENQDDWNKCNYPFQVEIY